MKSITVKGTWEEMGRALGRIQKREISRVHGWLTISPRFRRLLEQQAQFLKASTPEAMRFLHGMSEGSTQSFEKMIAFCSWEDLIFKGDHCSTVLGEEHGKWFVGYNEDDIPFWRGMLTHVKFFPKQGVAFESIHYPGSIPGASIGINQHQLCVSMNSIYRRSEKPLIGWPAYVGGFSFFQSRNWNEVEKVYKKMQANSGMHFLIVQGSSRAMSIECMPGSKAKKIVKPGFVHTNHPLFPAVKPGSMASLSSLRRLRNLGAFVSSPKSLHDAKSCLLTPENQHGTFKAFGPKKSSVTLATAIAIPQARRLMIIHS